MHDYEHPQADAQVVKILEPSSDGGLFNLLIDGTERATDVGDQGHTSKVVLGIGPHSVSETAGTDTSLGDYRATFGGNCDENGDVTLGAGDNKTCTITNVRRTFKVIVLVCEGGSLYSSTVTVDGVDKVSLGSNGAGTLSDADLCGLGGAAYPDKVTGHPANITILKQQV